MQHLSCHVVYFLYAHYFFSSGSSVVMSKDYNKDYELHTPVKSFSANISVSRAQQLTKRRPRGSTGQRLKFDFELMIGNKIIEECKIQNIG